MLGGAMTVSAAIERSEERHSSRLCAALGHLFDVLTPESISRATDREAILGVLSRAAQTERARWIRIGADGTETVWAEQGASSSGPLREPPERFREALAADVLLTERDPVTAWVPIHGAEGPLGYLYFQRSDDGAPWSPEERSLLGVISRLFARTFAHAAEREESRQRLEMLDAVLEHGPVSIFWKDLDCQVLGGSKVLADWMRQDWQSGMEVRPDLPLDPESVAFYERADRRVMDEDRVERDIYEPLNGPGGLQVLRTTKVPLHDAEGRVRGLIGFSVDVTAETSEALLANEGSVGASDEVGMFECDLRQRVAATTPTLRRQLGVHLEEMATLPDVRVALGPARTGILSRALVRARERGQTVSAEIFGAEGRRLWVRARWLEDRQRLVGFVVDVSEQHRLIEEARDLNLVLSRQVEDRDSALEAKDALLEAIATEVPGVLFQTFVKDDGTRGVVYVGPGLERLGVSAHEPQDLERVGMLPDPSSLRALSASDFGAEHTLVPEWMRERRFEVAGRERWLRSIARPSRIGQETRFSGVLLDVTTEHEALASLRASEARLHTVSDALPVGLFLREGSELSYVNDAYVRLLGRTKKVDVLAAVHPEDRDALRDALEAAERAPYRRTLEVRAHPRALSDRWVRVALAAVRVEGRTLATVGALEDVTRARKLAEETMASLVRSEELHRLKTRVLSTVSHEFRTPLTAIDMATQYLERHVGDSDPRATRSVRRIRAALASLNELMDDILMYARIESGRLEVVREPCRVDRLVEEVVERLEATNLRDRVDLEQSELLRGRVIDTDPRLLRLVLANLLSNALKYSREEVVVRTALEEPQMIIEVHDRGIGVVTGELESVMQPFFRGSNAAEPGTGLGLAIARSSVEALGGRLVMESRSGHGTVARIEMKI